MGKGFFDIDGNSCEMTLTFYPEAILEQGQITLLHVLVKRNCNNEC